MMQKRQLYTQRVFSIVMFMIMAAEGEGRERGDGKWAPGFFLE